MDGFQPAFADRALWDAVDRSSGAQSNGYLVTHFLLKLRVRDFYSVASLSLADHAFSRLASTRFSRHRTRDTGASTPPSHVAATRQ